MSTEIIFSTEEEKSIVEDYSINKICLQKLAKKYHHNLSKITSILDKYNIPHGRGVIRTGQSNEKCIKHLNEEECKIVFDIYSNGGAVVDCCKAVKCGQDVLRRALQDLGIYKTHNERILENPQNQRKYQVNENLFLKQDSNLAYLLGFLASDGTVRKDKNEIKLTLAAIDKEILDKFYDIYGGRPVKTYISSNGFESSTWEFTSKIVKDELEKYSIVPNKTFVLKPPVNLNKKFYIDYIRGYFDGDGSINYLKNTNSIRWQICSVTKEILEWIINFLWEEYHIAKVNIYQDNRNKQSNLYYFQYSTTAAKQIYSILYPQNCLYLKRKKDKFDKYIQKK